MHDVMARMQNAHMHIYSAIAPRHALQGSYGTLYGSREQKKHRGAKVFMWYSMVFNAWCPQGYGHHDWFVDIHVVNLKKCITYLALWDLDIENTWQSLHRGFQYFCVKSRVFTLKSMALQKVYTCGPLHVVHEQDRNIYKVWCAKDLLQTRLRIWFLPCIFPHVEVWQAVKSC